MVLLFAPFADGAAVPQTLSYLTRPTVFRSGETSPVVMAVRLTSGSLFLDAIKSADTATFTLSRGATASEVLFANEAPAVTVLTTSNTSYALTAVSGGAVSGNLKSTATTLVIGVTSGSLVLSAGDVIYVQATLDAKKLPATSADVVSVLYSGSANLVPSFGTPLEEALTFTGFPVGPAGPPGPAGAAGPAGASGATGAAGQSVVGASEPAGSNCAAGGVKLVAASGTTFVCNGLNGAPGMTGLAGAAGPAGATGAAGPIGLTGPAGAAGAAGASVAASSEAAGTNCRSGGVKLQTVSGAFYLCNGAGGLSGPQGPAGPGGPAGPQGLAGASGATGPAGAVGPGKGGCATGTGGAPELGLLLWALSALGRRRRRPR